MQTKPKNIYIHRMGPDRVCLSYGDFEWPSYCELWIVFEMS